jgi:short-chain Z-isoprenyl diphosphate synthase
VRNLIYRIYEGRLASQLTPGELPRHIGVILDGNRRWAALKEGHTAKDGHTAGALKTKEFLTWCSDLNINLVTLYMLSTDNLTNRKSQELDDLIEVIDDLVKTLVEAKRWRLQLVGDRAMLPEKLAKTISDAEKATSKLKGTHVNLAVAYGGRHEITDAVKSILASHKDHSIDKLAELLTPELITKHLYTSGQPDPDLVIRTSGEQRLSGFLLWQSANSEFYFEEALWPDFRKVDFLRAIRAFENRHRRFGS